LEPDLCSADIGAQLPKQERNLGARNRLAEEEALKLHATVGTQNVKLLLGLNPSAVVITPRLEPSSMIARVTAAQSGLQPSSRTKQRSKVIDNR
jgi:hypothetical protein